MYKVRRYSWQYKKYLGTIHKLRRQLRGRGVSKKPLIAYAGGRGGYQKTYLGEIKRIFVGIDKIIDFLVGANKTSILVLEVGKSVKFFQRKDMSFLKFVCV